MLSTNEHDTNKAKKTSIMPPNSKKIPPTFEFEYSEAPEASDWVSIPKKSNHFINGKFIKAHTGKTFKTINPANLEILSEVPDSSKKDVDQAVQSAKKAYKETWSKISGQGRSRYLFRIARLIQERSREFAILESLDNGKPIKESRDIDIPLASAHFFYYAGWADKLEYAVNGKKVRSLGVAGQIIPWNFPLLMAAWKIAPALAAGNTVVLKPAETTPLTALRLAEVIRDAGLPDGVVNIITGAGEAGAALVSHPDIQKIAFTGSTEVGKKIATSLAGTSKRLTLELGGKSAHIIFEDAAIDQAVEGIINGIFFNQGHVCCAGSRLLVEESVASEVVRKLKRRMNQLRVGNPMDKNTDIGAINSKKQLTKIQSLVSIAKQEGMEFYEPESTKLPKNGYFHKPCFFNQVSSSATISRTEVFGPVLAISTFRTPDEAIQKANDTPYGLAAGIWTDKGGKIQKVAQKLKAGIIWANTYNKFDPTSPFGGFYESGWGREGGRHGLFPYLEVE